MADSESLFHQIIKTFIPYSGYAVDDYFGVSMTSIKKNGYYSIRLLYDYKKHACMSKNSMEIPDIDRALTVYKLLDKNKRDKTDKFSIDDLDLTKIEKEEKPW